MMSSIRAKKFFRIFLIAVNAWPVMPLFSGTVPFVSDGVATAKIYVSAADLRKETEGAYPPLEIPYIRLAVEDLNYHLQRMSGVSLQVVETDDEKSIEGTALVLGTLAEKLGCTVKPSKWREGYRILADGQRVLVQGEMPQGVSYGIYALLEKLGCDWVMPGKLGEIVPKRSTVGIPAFDESSAPAFGMRELWYRGGAQLVAKRESEEFELWKRRQKLGVSQELMSTGSGHAWDSFIALRKEAFANDPAMLALVRRPDGSLVRQGPQLEVANPKIAPLIADIIKEKFASEGWAKDRTVTYPIGPADGDGFSISPEALELGSGRKDPVMGGDDATDQVVKLANDVLGLLGKEYPNLSLGYYVYSVHAEYPSRQEVSEKIFPIFAPISYSRLHSCEDASSKTRAYYREILEQWGKTSKSQGNRMLVHDYNWNLADNMLPFTRLKTVSDDLRMYKRLGFSGLLVEATKAWAINGPHDYVYAKMAWDVSLEWKRLLAAYCLKAFGPAAGDMERYYSRLVDKQSTAGQEAGSYFTAPLIFDAEYIRAAEKDLKAAKEKELDADQRARVEAAAYPLRTLKRYLAWHQAMGRFDFAEAQDAYDAILAEWRKQLEKNPQFVAREVPEYMGGLMKASTSEALKYASAPYRILVRLPEALPTALDPTNQGERLNLMGEKINDRGWIKTHTYNSTWDAQGLGGYREGAVWYRTKFALPKTARDEHVGLFLGGFEDEARVWVNGKFIGSSGIKFANPAVFDLGGAIRPDEDNLLAIQIRRNSQINEIGLGGILRPGFIFAGPRFDVPSTQEDGVRVLPGGEKVRESNP